MEHQIAYKIIPLESYPRLKHFEYFKEMANPYVGVTVKVDISEFLTIIRDKKLPFFLSFLYCVSNAANSVAELRQRIYKGSIIEYQRCPTSHTVALENDTYCYCKLDSNLAFDAYLPYALQIQDRAKAEQCLEDEEDSLSLFFISTLPWITYESFIQPTPNPADSNPRITWGRFIEQNGQFLMPVSILCHHALVDGLHLSQFYQNLELELRKFGK